MNQEELVASIIDIPLVKRFPPLVFLPFLLFGFILHLLRPWKIFPNRVPGHLLGWPLIGVAIAIAGWAERTMEAADESPLSEIPTETLVTGGPFSYSRNPIYISIIMIYTGICFVLNSYWPLTFLPLPFKIMDHGIVPREEQYLESMFGEEYRSYQSQVGRWGVGR